ncbi:MAG: hydrogenase nickel incorporation protein HypB [candidate division Zixibacteria bacterium]|nr:hydrogenase nickel incorporation protein HypB [candidate division Zixibacteria bacterium]NIR66703.1 hydrogenase nickel incorporation protein HypB [candidate division Zixibacteria bacterium]NIS14892.1 hydrogenase nickel incorporation protein HypB [candidate division Zixibacteria bacterium]NIS48242.1 hydrogenase nickel incorporation protein HypB [candidate division Zixibacteria bacterium]NIT51411.1 hydrogenase nickel incorporation protein HypB [candidate division Zixibacteria bacterium]
MAERVQVEEKVLSENDKLAAQIRKDLGARKILALNLVSSPGSGKTSLLEKTLSLLKDEFRIGLIAGDVQTENDAIRLERAGGKIVRPVVTGGACHLDARMVGDALQKIDLNSIDILFIENVGNLVCPSGFDLGEDMKVVLISTTEGDDKPLKYPAMFRKSSALMINKIDLLGLSDFDIDKAEKNARQINGSLHIMRLSCRTGENINLWCDWLRNQIFSKK